MIIIDKTITLPYRGETLTFRLRKPDAFSGAFLLRIILRRLLPVIESASDMLSCAEKEFTVHDMYALAEQFLSSLAEDELRRLMTICLRHVDLSLPAGWQPVMLRDTFGVDFLEHDTPLCLALCCHETAYTCKGFFDEGGALLRPLTDPLPNT